MAAGGTVEESYKKRRGPSDATDYSSTQAPATQKYAEGRRPHPSDERLEPGGERGSDEATGIASVDPKSQATPTRGTSGTDPMPRANPESE